MFYNSTDIDEDLKCSYCKEKFIDVVKLLPSCGESICGRCYEELQASLKNTPVKFECKACQASHRMPEEGLTDNMGLSRLLKRRKVEKPLSEQAVRLKERLQSLANLTEELKPFDDDDHVCINRFCDQLDSRVNQELERIVKLLDGIRNMLLKETAEYRQKCLETLAARSSAQPNSDGGGPGKARQDLQALFKQVDSFCQKWNGFFSQANAYASDKEIDAALGLSFKHETGLRTLSRQLKLSALNNQMMTFKTSHSIFDDPSSLRKMFELSFEDPARKELRIEPSRLRTLTGHSDDIRELLFLSDATLASCSEDKTIIVWDVQEGTKLYELTGHTHSVTSLALLAYGGLASGSKDATIKVWSLEKRRKVRTLKGHENAVAALQLLKNNNLASYAADDTIRIWNPYKIQDNLLLVIPGHEEQGWLHPFGVLSNDDFVTISRAKNSLRVWNPVSGDLVKSVSAGFNSIFSLLILANDQVALGFQDGQIEIIDLTDDSKSRKNVNAHEDTVFALAQLSNGNLVSADDDYFDSTIIIWSLLELNPLQVIKPTESRNFSLAISPNEELLASGCFDWSIELWPIITS